MSASCDRRQVDRERSQYVKFFQTSFLAIFMRRALHLLSVSLMPAKSEYLRHNLTRTLDRGPFLDYGDNRWILLAICFFELRKKIPNN